VVAESPLIFKAAPWAQAFDARAEAAVRQCLECRP
jgi:hypothetical protein